MNNTLTQQHIENLITRPVARYKWAVYLWDWIVLPCLGLGVYFFFFPDRISVFTAVFFYIFVSLYTLIPYRDTHAGLFLPRKFFIDPNLKQDIQQAIYLKDHGIITAIKKPKCWFTGSLYFIEICSSQTQQCTWYSIYLNTVILSQNTRLSPSTLLSSDCIGQSVEFAYLPQSKQIVQIFAEENDHVLQYIDVIMPPQNGQRKTIIKGFPAKLAHELKKAKRISAIRDDTLEGDFQIVITTFSNQTYIIPSNTPHFDQLEQLLNEYLRMSTNYLSFKRHSEQKDLIIFEDKWEKRLSKPYTKWLIYIGYGVLTIVAILAFPKISDLSINLTFFILLSFLLLIRLLHIFLDSYQEKYQALL